MTSTEPLAVALGAIRIDPPLLIDTRATACAWTSVEKGNTPRRAQAADPDGRLLASLAIRREAGTPATDEPDDTLVLSWRLAWQAHWTGAIELPLHVPVTAGDAPALFLPAIQDDLVVGGTGVHPRLDVARGFAVRGDRLPQVAIVTADRVGATVVSLPDETPRPARPGFVVALTGALEDDAVRLAVRYPQAEWGHVADPPGAAYLAKGSAGAGEDRRARWQPGDRTRLTIEVIVRPGAGIAAARAIAARRRWTRRRPRWNGGLAPATVAMERRRWIDAHLWNGAIGQYASPEGSAVAMLGFVEMSLHAAVTAARLGRLAGDATGAERAESAVTDWATSGTTAEGLLLPVRSPAGYGLGRRDYAEGSDYAIEDPGALEPMRVLTEARALLGLARQATGGDAPGSDASLRRAAAGSADALLARIDPDGLHGLLHLDGTEGPRNGAATAGLVALLADLALDEPDRETAGRRLRSARDLHDRLLAPALADGRFGGVTLDASAPDREGVLAALEGALALHEATRDPAILDAARTAVDNLLAYVLAYSIRTFPPESDAATRAIETLGGSVVSAENQHLDPFPVGTALVRYGLMADDPVAVRAGIANLAFCLDGRWAFTTPDGLKQSEQLNHTAWHYTHWFTGRGDIRLGMPKLGRLDSEHGWSQVLPIAAWLEVGDVTVDWPSGRCASLDPRRRATALRSGDTLAIDLGHPPTTGRLTLLRVLRPPAVDLRLTSPTLSASLRWPSTLVAIPVPSMGTVELMADRPDAPVPGSVGAPGRPAPPLPTR